MLNDIPHMGPLLSQDLAPDAQCLPNPESCEDGEAWAIDDRDDDLG